MIKRHVIAVARIFRHLHTRTETMLAFCNTCQKVLLTVKNMHPPEHHQRRRIVCAFEKICSGADVLLFWISMKKFPSMYLFFDLCTRATNDSVNLFKSQFITWMESLKLPPTKKMIQLQIHCVHNFFSSMTNEIKSGKVKSHIVKAFAMGCDSICCRFWASCCV